MIKTIFIVGKGAAGVIGRVNADAFPLAGEFLLQCLQRQQVIAKDQPVLEDVAVRKSLRGVIRPLRVFE